MNDTDATTNSTVPSGQLARFIALVEPITDDFGCELVDVEYASGVARVVIDQPDGLGSQALVDVTKAISRMVDAEDPISGRFTLEVTSPGVERPLKRPDHFVRAIGESVNIKTGPDVDGERRIHGTLTAADEYGVTVAGENGDRTLAYGEIRTARTVFDWGPTPKQGGQKNGAQKNVHKNAQKKRKAS